MTWSKSSLSLCVAPQQSWAARLLGLSLVALVVAACGSSSKNATIEITAPEKGQVLTSNDDLDDTKPGLQYTVTAASTDVAPGTDVILRIEGETDAPISTVGRDGLIEFEKVTLPEGSHTLKVTTGNGGVQSADDWDYTYKALVIESPRDGAALGLADDKDPDIDGVQVNITVKTYAIDLSEDVSLQVDNQTVGSPMSTNAMGSIVFSGVTLENGEHTLRAIAGTAESAIVHVSVNPDCASATFVTPAAPQDGDLILPGASGDACPDDGQPYKTDFIVSTDAGTGRVVELYVNGTLFKSTVVEGSVATFRDVELDRYNTPNAVEVAVQSAQGVTCERVQYPVDIQLDCAGVDCSISAPSPVSGDDGKGNLVEYLNASQKGDDGFEFVVHTDEQAIGHDVKLIIDGQEMDAPSAAPSGSDPDVKATLSGVQLDDGKHTIYARCEHEGGAIGFSRRLSWIVDTEPCGVSIQEPSEDTLLVPGLDVDDKISGVQTALESKLTGTDCSRARAAVCDPADGIADNVGFEDIDGSSSLTTTVTLANEAAQTLCLEIRDRAGNDASDSVAVRYLPQAPKLLIESPTDGAKVNASGGTGFIKDSDRGSATVCNADFDVACSQLGSTVSLHRNDANGTVFSTAMCSPVGSGDPALPDGYAGRARFSDAVFLPQGDDAVTVVATQAAQSSGETMVGESQAIMLSGDCELPTLTFSGDDPCEGGQIGVDTMDAIVTKTIVVDDATSDTMSATLSVTSGSMSYYTANATASAGTFTFPSAELGPPGDTGRRSFTIAVSASDDYNNTGTVSCQTEVAFDLPELMVTTPVEGAAFTTVAPASPELCTPTGSTATGITVAATADAAEQRTAAVSVNGGAPIALTLNATNISGCVPIEPGPNELSFSLTSAQSMATATVVRNVSLVTTLPTTGITLSAPTVSTTREGTATLSWTLPEEDYPGQFASYDLRCWPSPLDLGAGNAWWDGARVVPLPADFKPPATTVQIDVRTGENAYCQLRAADAAGNLTPLTSSISVYEQFREQVFTVPTTTAGAGAGMDVSGVGDVNGDGIDDLLVGGYGRAYLVFGSATGWATGTPDVVFSGGNSATQTDSFFGWRVAGIGDFNADGRPDFVISEQRSTQFAPDRDANSGRVHVFFGRTTGDSWPATVDLSNGTTCGSDICFTATSFQRFGSEVGPAGDFDGDGTVDLGVGANTFRTGASIRDGRFYVLLGGNIYQQGVTRTGDFFGIDVPVESGMARRGFVMTGDALNVALLGQGFASVGNFDSVAGDDLVVAAFGSSDLPGTTDVDESRPGGLFYLSGRTYTGPELVTLTMGDLGFRNGAGGTPDGMAIATGPTPFALSVAALGNAYDLPGAGRAGTADFATSTGDGTTFEVYLGDSNFNPADKLVVSAGAGGASYFGRVICTGTDIDGDGLSELCASSRYNLVTSAPPGIVGLWYSDNFRLGVSDRTAYSNAGTMLEPALNSAVDPASGVIIGGLRIPDFVGDLNGDGKTDMAVGTPSANAPQGEFVILY